MVCVVGFLGLCSPAKKHHLDIIILAVLKLRVDGQEHGVCLDRITRSVHGKSICIIVNFVKTQPGIYVTDGLESEWGL